MSALPSDTAPMADLKRRHRESKQALIDSFVGKRPSAAVTGRLLRSLAQLTDHTLCEIAQHTGLPVDLALVAVGGYGRGELFPHSDVDVLLLLPDHKEHDAAYQERAGLFITACWDCGLEIGSSVRTVKQCAS
ncbi:MAG: hypothetical protein RIR43_2386, partial [Pseudomonadota bacterium]